MKFNYSKLRGRIVEIFGSQTEFAQAMGWSERTLSLRMGNKRLWRQNDICRASELLGIDNSEIPAYFFVKEVQKIEQEEERDWLSE